MDIRWFPVQGNYYMYLQIASENIVTVVKCGGLKVYDRWLFYIIMFCIRGRVIGSFINYVTRVFVIMI